MGVGLIDRIRAQFSTEHAVRVERAKAEIARVAAERRYLNSIATEDVAGWWRRDRRGTGQRRTDPSYSRQSWGQSLNPEVSPLDRRNRVRRSRRIDDVNILGSSMLDRTVDNVIGEGMILQATTTNKRFNKSVEAAWKDVDLDVTGLRDLGELQRGWFRSYLRDGDIAALMTHAGVVQTIETDRIQSPDGSDDNVVEGVRIDAAGKPITFYVLVMDGRERRYVSRSASDIAYLAHNDRMGHRDVRGIPVMAQLGWLLEQVDGTIESVVMAHRMSAMFGLIHKRKDPHASFNAISSTSTNADGNSQKTMTLEPAMYQWIGEGEDVVQVKPEHPTTSFSDFMRMLVRFGGMKLGLPLELALMDFSQTNYSSARASMEQAYRRFRIHQKRFARQMVSPIYRWWLINAIEDGVIRNAPPDPFGHSWMGQPWPYLDPQKEAEAALVATDGGLSTLTMELAKRGMDFDEWLQKRSEEVAAIEASGVDVSKSSKTRDAVDMTSVAAPAAPNEDEENDDAEDDA